MRFVKPEVFLISKSVPQKEAIAKWLQSIGCDEPVWQAYSEGLNKTDAERIVELAGRRCYLSFQPQLNPNVQKIRTDIADYCTNILRVGHGSVCEHAYFTFAIENVSRVFTGEMNRHRAGMAISEGSMRYIRFNDIPMVETPLLTITAEDKADPQYQEYMRISWDQDVSHLKSVAVKKQKTRELFEQAFSQDESIYGSFCSIWYDELKPDSNFVDKKHVTSLGRRAIGMGVATGGVWTGNVRALRHICEMRCSEAAEEEIALVAGMILETMMKEEPNLFGDFHLNEKGYWVPTYEKV